MGNMTMADGAPLSVGSRDAARADFPKAGRHAAAARAKAASSSRVVPFLMCLSLKLKQRNISPRPSTCRTRLPAHADKYIRITLAHGQIYVKMDTILIMIALYGERRSRAGQRFSAWRWRRMEDMSEVMRMASFLALNQVSCLFA